MPLDFASILEEIESSDAFKNFKERNPEAELCAGFFVIDFEQENKKANQQQLDYCLPDGKIFTFILNKEITIKEAETIEGHEQKKLEKLDKEKIKVDLDDVENILEDKLKTEGIDKKVNKIIAILHKYESREIWNLNCMLEGMEILQVHINCESGDILKFEKRSMFDFIRRVK